MMGRSHVIMAGLGWMAAAPSVAQHFHRPLTLPEVLVSTVTAAGFGLCPDIDHPQATIARTLGPVTKAICGFIGQLAGGHRKGTHTLLFAALVDGLVVALYNYAGRIGQLTLYMCAAFLMCWAIRLRITKARRREAVFLAQAIVMTAVADWADPGTWWWLPWAAAGGTLLHLVADGMTTGGVPLFLPLTAKRYSIPIAGDTGGPGEAVITWLAVPAFAWVLAATIDGAQWWHLHWLLTLLGGH